MKVVLRLAQFIKKNGLLLVILLISLSAGGYFYFQYQAAQKEIAALKANPRTLASEESKQLVSNVGKLVELPSENPTVATVTDAKKLKEQPFFAKAANGDKLLIYTGAKKAILFRPSTNKIIEVAPVNIGKQGTDVAGASTQQFKVALYNGTDEVGATNRLETQLKEKIKNLEIVSKENAGKKDYAEVLVVDLSNGKYKGAVDEIAKAVRGKVSKLPDGEKKPEAEFLIIYGKEQPQE